MPGHGIFPQSLVTTGGRLVPSVLTAGADGDGRPNGGGATTGARLGPVDPSGRSATLAPAAIIDCH